LTKIDLFYSAGVESAGVEVHRRQIKWNFVKQLVTVTWNTKIQQFVDWKNVALSERGCFSPSIFVWWCESFVRCSPLRSPIDLSIIYD